MVSGMASERIEIQQLVHCLCPLRILGETEKVIINSRIGSLLLSDTDTLRRENNRV